jgi:hypothetical protein
VHLVGERDPQNVIAAAGVKLEKWIQHDLRRSAATGTAELGIAPHIVEAVLNRVSGHKAGIAGVYNRATYEKEKLCGPITSWRRSRGGP